MPVVQNVARDPAGNPARATVTVRLIAGDPGSVSTPGYTGDGTVLGTYTARTDADGVWSIDLPPNADYLPTGTYYQVTEQLRGSRVTFEHLIEVPDVAGPVDMVGLLVDDPDEPNSLYILVTQKGADGGVATLDEDGQVPADQLANAPGGGGGGAVSSVFGRTGVVVAQSGDYTKAQVGLSNVDNTADASKPVSTLQAAADTAVAAAAASALSTHAADTTAVHGITDTAALVLTDDSRLTNARTPTAHASSHASAGSDPVTLAQSQITGLTAALAGKSDTGHVHAGADITSGTVAFDRLPTGTSSTTVAIGNHTHGGGGGGAVDSVNGETGTVVLDATNTPPASIGAAAASHTHAQADITSLTTDLGNKQPLDGDLTAIAALTPTNDDVMQRKAGAWTNRTPAQLKTDLALAKGDVGLSNVDNTSDASKPISTLTQAALDAKQPLDADLTTIAGLTATTDNMIQSVGSAWASRTPAQVKTALSLNNVDNTTDAGKPVSTATQAALDAKQPLDADLTTIAGLTATTDNVLQSVGSAWASRTPAQLKSTLALAKGDVGLGNVDNTADTAKPVSTAQQAALDLKANLASPTFTGTPSLPTGTTGVTQSAGNSTTALATTAFVTTADALKADLASPAFTGNPTAPTQSQGNSSTRLATTAYVQTEAGLLIPKSLIDAKGDLIVGTAADTVGRLAVGVTNGHVLTVDSAETSGMKWAAAAGGSGTDYKSGASPKTGLWYRGNYGPVGSNLTLTLNRLYAAPFRLNATTTFDRIGIDVVTAAAATGVARLAIYQSDATGGLPGTLVLDAGTVDIASTGGKAITISQQLTAGFYWLAIVGQTATGGAVRATVSYDPMVPYFSGASMFTGSTAPGGISSTGTSYTGALASNPTIADNDNCPIIGLRSA
jgi:hypothetical protein